MTSMEYKVARQLRGTQASVAAALGVHPRTISKRETGRQMITREAEIALITLPKTNIKRAEATEASKKRD